jgi:hypothetical protein
VRQVVKQRDDEADFLHALRLGAVYFGKFSRA